MSDLYTELLIKRETPSGEKAMKAAMIVVTVLAGVAGILVHPLILILFLGMCVLDYFKFPAFDLEFEYLYVNGELDIDKIMSKQKRKRAESVSMEHVELVAPSQSHELDYYRQNGSIKVKDYSSGRQDARVYAMITSKEEKQEMILFEPDEVILNDMKRIAPRKVKLS